MRSWLCLLEAFNAQLTVDARFVAKIPDGLTFEQAATIPTVFLTAWYVVLHDLARLKARRTPPCARGSWRASQYVQPGSASANG